MSCFCLQTVNIFFAVKWQCSLVLSMQPHFIIRSTNFTCGKARDSKVSRINQKPEMAVFLEVECRTYHEILFQN